MILIVCAVWDSAVQAYNRPAFVPARGAAVRMFGDEVNRVAPDNPLNAHSSDFELHCLGEFDDSTGLFTSSGCVCLARGKDFRS